MTRSRSFSQRLVKVREPTRGLVWNWRLAVPDQARVLGVRSAGCCLRKDEARARLGRPHVCRTSASLDDDQLVAACAARAELHLDVVRARLARAVARDTRARRGGPTGERAAPSEPRSSTCFVPGRQRIRFVSSPAGRARSRRPAGRGAAGSRRRRSGRPRSRASPRPARRAPEVLAPGRRRRRSARAGRAAGSAAESCRSAAVTSSRPHPVSASRRERAGAAAGRRIDVARGPVRSAVTCSGRSVRAHARQNRRGSAHLRRRERRPLALAALVRPAGRVALLDALLRAPRSARAGTSRRSPAPGAAMSL